MMLLLGRLAKVQGLKGEFLLDPTTDSPEKIPELAGLLLASPEANLSECEYAPLAKQVTVRAFRWHQDRPCLAFHQMPDRTAAEPFKDWALWIPQTSAELQEGESYRHDWVGCQVFVDNALVGEVLDLEPSPGGYDMVHIKDLRPGRHGVRDVPYIKAWFNLDLCNRRIDLTPPIGLLDV
jgi:16S rRNA processing protein RimM